MGHANPLKWILTKGELSREEVLQTESVLGVTFPADYVACILQQNGGQPIPDTFDFTGRTEAVFNSLIDLTAKSKRNMIEVYQALKSRLPNRIYPFADDPFGNYLCFDYREGEDPSIVFWDHEEVSVDRNEAVGYVCRSFSELLDKLYEI